MDLSAVMSGYLGSESRGSLKEASRFYHIEDFIQMEAAAETDAEAETAALRAEAFASTLFWQIFLASPSYPYALAQAGASPMAITNSEIFVVAHGDEHCPRFDLVVFDPGRETSELSAITIGAGLDSNRETSKLSAIKIEAGPDSLQEGWRRWDYLHRNRWREWFISQASQRYWLEDSKISHVERLLNRVDRSFAIEAIKVKQFGILVARPPVREYTSIPSPAWGVGSFRTGPTTSTAGWMGMNADKHFGVTVSYHALIANQGVVIPGKTQTYVDGTKGTVISADLVSDSCFVKLDSPSGSWRFLRGGRGPLIGVSPRVYQPVTFEGIGSSGINNTIVSSWSPEIPFAPPQCQLRVLTLPVTNPGDSGAALVDNDDYILGFSFYRTGVGQAIEYSAWIWADSVFAAHGLTP